MQVLRVFKVVLVITSSDNHDGDKGDGVLILDALRSEGEIRNEHSINREERHHSLECKRVLRIRKGGGLHEKIGFGHSDENRLRHLLRVPDSLNDINKFNAQGLYIMSPPHSYILIPVLHFRYSFLLRGNCIYGLIRMSPICLQNEEGRVGHVPQRRYLVIHIHFRPSVLEMDQIAVALTQAAGIGLQGSPHGT